MTAHATAILHTTHDRSLWRWICAAALVLLVHAGFIYWMTRKHADDSPDSAATAVMIELPPMEITPQAEAVTEVTPGPQMTEAAPEEVESQEMMALPEVPPAPKPDAVLAKAHKPKLRPKPKPAVETPPKPKPDLKKNVTKPVMKRPHERPADHTSAPVRSGATRAAAAARRGASGSTRSPTDWTHRVFAKLLQHKPSAANQTGVVVVSFTVNRSGHILGAHANGSPGLAAAAMAMVRGANPLPPPPPQMGASVNLSVPVRFH